jgi:glutaredoxin
MSEPETKNSSEAKNSPDVKIYSLSTCSHCKATKKFLGECTIKYEFIDVDLLEGDERKAIIEDVKKFNPRCSFPTVSSGIRSSSVTKKRKSRRRSVWNERTAAA